MRHVSISCEMIFMRRHVGVLSVHFFMFLNFDQLDLHTKTCIASTQFGLKISPTLI